MLQVHTVKAQQIGELDAVDGAQAVELKDTGDRIGIHHLGQPGIGNVKVRIPFRFRNSLAQVRNVTGSNSQARADLLQLFSGGTAVEHGAFYLKAYTV